jgi:2-polyprenyl-3-methyl-5-hydroxy-6-metoxy-1,4-benzoquinol methylase
MTDKLLPFDIVICTDVIEHVEDWRKAVDQLKQITKVNGKIIITVPAIGFPYHGWPYDYWRYTLTDLLYIFRDFLILNYKQVDRGVFVKLKKVSRDIPDNSDYKLYSILRGYRVKNLTRFDKSLHYPRKIQRVIAKRLRKAIVYILPRFVKNILIYIDSKVWND